MRKTEFMELNTFYLQKARDSNKYPWRGEQSCERESGRGYPMVGLPTSGAATAGAWKACSLSAAGVKMAA